MTSFANVSHHHGYNLVIKNRWFQKKKMPNQNFPYALQVSGLYLL